MITSVKGLEYGGKYNHFFWTGLNPLATVTNCLPNCTTFVLGDLLADKLPNPLSNVYNANQWHLYLTNGYTLHDFDYSNVQLGDILEWTSGNHVARVTKISKGQIYVSASFYTGIHGKAYYNGAVDTRTGLNSLQDVSNFMLLNYPVRFFHHWTLEEENKWVGYSPRYIIKPPQSVVKPVERDKSKNQINVLTNEQNVRNNKNDILGVAQMGWYNVLDIKESNGYKWCEVEDNKYIALVSGRVIYYEADEIKETLQDEIEKLKKENEELKQRLIMIQEEAKYE